MDIPSAMTDRNFFLQCRYLGRDSSNRSALMRRGYAFGLRESTVWKACKPSLCSERYSQHDFGIRPDAWAYQVTCISSTVTRALYCFATL